MLQENVRQQLFSISAERSSLDERPQQSVSTWAADRTVPLESIARDGRYLVELYDHLVGRTCSAYRS